MSNYLDIVKNWADHIGEYALLLAAVATIVMALLELVKAVTAYRGRFHKKRVVDFIGEKATVELIGLAVGDKVAEGALYNQPTDKMMGQFGAAAKMALDFPQSYPELYKALTRTDGEEAATWAAFVQQLESAAGPEPSDADQRRATRARARIDQSVTRKLDAFQLRTEFVWARINQSVAVGGATIFLAFLLWPMVDKSPVTYGFSCITGGLISPFAKDVVTALSNLRTKWS
jgi:hypothetical protein